MNVLAFDTCLGAISVALRHRRTDGAWATAEVVSKGGGAHAEHLLPMIRDLLSQNGTTFTELQRLAVTLGPGTFTGVRTGIAAARALRLATGIETVGTTSLAIMARRAFALAGGVVLTIWARQRHENYTATFDGKDGRHLYPPRRKVIFPFIY